MAHSTPGAGGGTACSARRLGASGLRRNDVLPRPAPTRCAGGQTSPMCSGKTVCWSRKAASGERRPWPSYALRRPCPVEAAQARRTCWCYRRKRGWDAHSSGGQNGPVHSPPGCVPTTEAQPPGIRMFSEARSGRVLYQGHIGTADTGRCPRQGCAGSRPGPRRKLRSYGARRWPPRGLIGLAPGEIASARPLTPRD